MADLPHVIQGQGGWVLPFNKIIDFYNAVGGGNSDALKVQSATGTDAVTAMNGATPNATRNIWWISFPGGKIVTVNVMLTTPDTVSSETVYGQIPSNLAPNNTITTASSYYDNSGTEIDANGQLYSAGTTGSKGGLTRWNATYIRKD